MPKTPRETPAFPLHPHLVLNPNSRHTGMTLRDYFAGQALMGWLASFGTDLSPKPKGCAEFAYEMADAMLAEREKASA